MGFCHNLVPQTFLVGHTQMVLEPKNSLPIHSESWCFSICGSQFHFFNPLVLSLSLLDLFSKHCHNLKGVDLTFVHYVQIETLQFFTQLWHHMPSSDAMTIALYAQSICDYICFSRVVLNI